MKEFLYSAPGERYQEHINSCLENFEFVFPFYEQTVIRLLNHEEVEKFFRKMIVFHDLGKLTDKWQENVGTDKKLPSHATIGAAYLWKILPEGLREPITFAVAIHHTDRGLLGDNIEKPDVQAILDGVVRYDGTIEWDKEAYNLEEKFFPKEAKETNINDLKEMARGLRKWARGCGLHEQHKRRLQALLAHHILKLCDISAATDRKDYQKENERDYYGGWLMVEDIKNYVDSQKIRMIAKKIKEKFNPQKIILFGSFGYGIPKKGSDLDLFIIMDTQLPLRKQASLIRRELPGSIPIDIIVRTPEQVEERIRLGDFFMKKIIKDGIVL